MNICHKIVVQTFKIILIINIHFGIRKKGHRDWQFSNIIILNYWTYIYIPKGRFLTLQIPCEPSYHIGMGLSALTRKLHEEHNDTCRLSWHLPFWTNLSSRVSHEPKKWPLMDLRVKEKDQILGFDRPPPSKYVSQLQILKLEMTIYVIPKCYLDEKENVRFGSRVKKGP